MLTDIQPLVDELVRDGWSRAAAGEIIRDAISQTRAHHKSSSRTQKIAGLAYQDWLKEASPEMVWDKPFHTHLCHHIDQILAGDLRQLMLFLPPRTGKSECVTIRLPVRYLEQHPRAKVVIGAYNRELATHFTSESLRLYRRRNPEMIDSDAQEEWTNKAGGSVLAVGVGSGVTGRGADLMVIDDPVKNFEEAISPAYQMRCWNWWLNDMRTRRNKLARTPTVLIMTRWIDLDLAGRILEKDLDRKKWAVVSFPALAGEDDRLGRKPGESIWPERLPEAELLEVQEEMGVRFDAMYQQDPTPSEGSVIKSEWFWYDDVPQSQVSSRVRFWDLAATEVNQRNSNPDYTAGCKMALIFPLDGSARYAVEDEAVIRAEPGARDTFIEDVARNDGPDVPQVFEENDAGDKSVTYAMRQRLQKHGIQVMGVKPRNDKLVRSTNARSALAKGEMFLVRGRWNNNFISELVRFPAGRHDDQVDSWSGAYNYLVMNALVVRRK